METKFVEVTNGEQNWGKFLLLRFDTEWEYLSALPCFDEGPELVTGRRPRLLSSIGWSRDQVWVLDLQTCEGVAVSPGGSAAADLEKHRVWVCPMFEPFL